METILNDAFDPLSYANHAPTLDKAKNKQILNALIISVGIIAIGIIIYQIRKVERQKTSKK